MKAVRFHRHGGPDVLVYEEAPEPELTPGEVLIRVRACALNHLDLWQRRGLPRVTMPMPHISGSDVAGDVVGANAADVGTGRRVMVQPGVSCGRCRECLSGKDNHCARYEVLGYLTHPGGYAEFVKVPVQNLVPIPDEIDYVQAAAFPLTFLTAWHMLMTRAQLTRGEETNRRGVDVVIEHVGEATWSKSVRSLARGGRLVTCGATTGASGALDLNALFGKQLSILGSYMGTKGELLRAARFFFARQLKPVIDRVFPLAEAAAAQKRLEESAQFGKIVLEV